MTLKKQKMTEKIQPLQPRHNREKLTSNAQTSEHTSDSPRQDAVFFPVSLIKLSVMSVFTLGFYDFYWFFRNWQKLSRNSPKPISPALRATFSVFYCFSFFKIVTDSARQNGLESKCPSPKTLTLAYVLLLVSSILPFPAGLVSWMAFIPLVKIQKTANALNSRLAPQAPVNNRFDWKDICALIIGISIFTLRYTVILSIQHKLTTSM